MTSAPVPAQSYWRAETVSPIVEMTLGAWLEAAAGRFPDRVAFVEADADTRTTRRWTYAELLRDAREIAFALLRRFAPGERIAIWAPNCAEWVLLQHAAGLAGLVLVTVNPAYLAAEVAYVLATSKAVGVFFSARYRATDQVAVMRAIAADLPLVRARVCLRDWDAFRATGNEPCPLPLVQPGDLAQIQFTSGTTGRPKGACLHHRGLLNASRFASLRAEFPEGGVWASAMPLFHVGGCAGSQFGAYARHGTFVMLTRFDAGFMLETIALERANHVHAVPTMVMAMMDHPSRPALDLTSLKVVMSGGTPIPAAMVRKVMAIFGCRFTITFGQTELNGVVCQTSPSDTPERQAETIGRPAAWSEIRIVDPLTGETVALHEPGEIWARGYQAMLGYFEMPDESAAALRGDGWLRTGDQASMDEHGYLRITGRLKDTIIRGGENIYPREIEDVLWAHEAIAQVAVVGKPDTVWGEIAVAVIRLVPDVPKPSADELHAYCRERLAAYKTPALWAFVDAFPTTSSGKIQKFRLREMVASGALPCEARTPTQIGAVTR